jgi:ABC-type multidrug transport system ATPase subunit
LNNLPCTCTLTGRENLIEPRLMLLQMPVKRIDEMLALVQLTGAAHKKAGQYSLGMKQRLGIALSPASRS